MFRSDKVPPDFTKVLDHISNDLAKNGIWLLYGQRRILQKNVKIFDKVPNNEPGRSIYSQNCVFKNSQIQDRQILEQKNVWVFIIFQKISKEITQSGICWLSFFLNPRLKQRLCHCWFKKSLKIFKFTKNNLIKKIGLGP